MVKLMDDGLRSKYERLLDILKGYGSVAVAFSSGVDSTFLLHAAKEALGERAVALTASSCFVPKREVLEAREFCEKIGVKHLVTDVDVLAIDGVSENPKDRCYLCKKALFKGFLDTAAREGLLAVAEGSNVDDEGDYRPGMKAIAELGVKSPLREAGLKKQEIRDLSKEFELPTWNKPSFACLASRIPYGEILTNEKLHMVEEAEEYLLNKGFKQFRVRVHGSSALLARIELLPEDIDRAVELSVREEINDKLHGMGFAYVALDLKGYRTGSLNEVLK